MTAENVYLACFVVGFAFSAVSFLLGTVHLPHWVHLPHLGIHHGVPLPQGQGPAQGARGGGGNQPEISPINLPTMAAFLAWFGGAGYLMTHYERIVGLLALLTAVLSGVFGASVIFLFMAKVLVRPDEALDPDDYEMVGVLGRLTVGIREGGTGEIVYVQGGTRKSAAARTETGEVMEKGAEVVVTRWEKGIAYVRRWEDMTGEPRPEELRSGDQQ